MNSNEIIKRLNGIFSDWIKISDKYSNWTIEDFPYETGVDEALTYPHCWRCVTVNNCCFKNEENKKPDEFDYSKYSFINSPATKHDLYHPNCHCAKLVKQQPKTKNINLLIPKGKYDWAIKDKGHLLKALGYRDFEFNDAFEILKKLVKEEFSAGNYNFRIHDEKGYRISLIISKFPRKNEDLGKFYKIKTGWTIFPNFKLKCNTLIGGLVE